MSIDLDHKLSVLAAAEEVPDAVAVRSNGDCLTYRELAKKVRDIRLDSVTRALTRLLPVLILRR